MEDIKNQEVAFLSRKILELNKKLIESDKVKSRFLSLVASELNNPMTALLGMIPHLIPDSGDPREKTFHLVHEEALMLDFRVQNIVAAAEIESGEIDISYSSVDVSVLAKEAIEALKYAIEAKNILVSIENTLDKKIVTDAKKVYLIIKNLLSNGCLYGIESGLIDIGIHQDDKKVVINVKNQGEGPNVEFKPQVYTRFSEGPQGVHGLGLGLSVVRDFCERLDGSIDYSVKEGSVTFTVTLPLETAEPTSDANGSNEFLFESFDDAIEL
ncbi:MAG: HAMP domain-containing sensor histidine kinase [Sulfuricurvum sp.]|nr:HAMP domain-containing sensor histidine kinase [Sulfuricurvum sp.]